VRGSGLRQRVDPVDVHLRAAAADEVVGAEEVVARPHRRAVDDELLPPEAVQRGRRVGAARRATDDDASLLTCGCERARPCRLPDRLDDDVHASGGRLLHRRGDVAGVVVDGHVGAPGARLRELLVAARRDDRLHAECATDLERPGRDAAADAPDQCPLTFLHNGFRDEHPVGGLVDERECRGLLERERVVEPVHLCNGERYQLAMRAVGLLADDVDAPSVLDARVDHDAVADAESVDAGTERFDDASAVRPQDPRFRHRRKPLPHPHVQVVHRGSCEADQHFALAGLRVGHVLVAQDLRAAVLVDADRLHGTILA